MANVKIYELLQREQSKHGIRQDDYARYRKHCVSKIKGCRQAIKKLEKSKQKDDASKKVKQFEELLFGVERCWAYAMQLRHEDEHRKRLHAVDRWKRGVQLAEKLEAFIKASFPAAECEVQGYSEWIKSQLAIERKNYTTALKGLSACRQLLIKSMSACKEEGAFAFMQTRMEEIMAWRSFLLNKIPETEKISIAFDDSPIESDLSKMKIDEPNKPQKTVSTVKSQLSELFAKWEAGSLDMPSLKKRLDTLAVSGKTKGALLTSLEAASLLSQKPMDLIEDAYLPKIKKSQALKKHANVLRLISDCLCRKDLFLGEKSLSKLKAQECIVQVAIKVAERDFTGAHSLFLSKADAMKQVYPSVVKEFSQAFAHISDAEKLLSANGLKLTPLGPAPIAGIADLSNLSVDFFAAPLKNPAPKLLPIKPIFYDLAYDHLSTPSF